MASRKRQPETMSLFGATKVSPPALSTPEIPKAPGMGRPEGSPDLPPDVQGGASPVVEERIVRLVHSVPKTEVIVEPDGPDHFVVSLLRHYGTTVASVRYSRAQLETLVQKSRAALEAG